VYFLDVVLARKLRRVDNEVPRSRLPVGRDFPRTPGRHMVPLLMDALIVTHTDSPTAAIPAHRLGRAEATVAARMCRDSMALPNCSYWAWCAVASLTAHRHYSVPTVASLQSRITKPHWNFGSHYLHLRRGFTENPSPAGWTWERRHKGLRQRCGNMFYHTPGLKKRVTRNDPF
jgi:hypothetical protein